MISGEPEAAPAELHGSPCDFESGGVRCRGWFYTPDKGSPHACVVMAHGFGASPDGPLGEIARRFASAGIAAFAFDYRHFGASDGEPRLVLDMRRQLDDWRAAIAYVRGRGDVDCARVGLWGSSLSGGQVLAVAARDRKIAAAVAQVPYADGWLLARAGGATHLLRSMPAVIRDLTRAARHRPPHLIEGLAPAPRSAIVRTPAEKLDEFATRAPSWRNQIAARSLLELYRFRPVRWAADIRCPLLVVLTYSDGLAPSDTVMRAAEKLSYVELAMFRGEHFEPYTGDTYERALRTEISFLAHHFH